MLNFNPRSPWGERLSLRYLKATLYVQFQSTLSVRRATQWSARSVCKCLFQSTLSVRRATNCSRPLPEWQNISIHALREESDNDNKQKLLHNYISIHALREESDFSTIKSPIYAAYFNPRSPWGERLRTLRASSSHLSFQSTLSVRRATFSFSSSIGKSIISIHALREESDPFGLYILPFSFWISIHALREESDSFRLLYHCALFIFQSTLSVRRATF